MSPAKWGDAPEIRQANTPTVLPHFFQPLIEALDDLIPSQVRR